MAETRRDVLKYAVAGSGTLLVNNAAVAQDEPDNDEPDKSKPLLNVPEKVVRRIRDEKVKQRELENLYDKFNELNVVEAVDGTPIIGDESDNKTQLVQKIGVFTIYEWEGLKLVKKKKPVYLKVRVPVNDVIKWLAFLGCLAGSTALIAALYSVFIGGPITAAVIASAIIVAAFACLEITGVTKKEVKNAKWEMQVG